MATVPTDLDARLALHPRVRSLSHASHSGSPTDSPVAISPSLPATPTLPPTAGTDSPPRTPLSDSPTLLSPPANSPENGLDSGTASPSDQCEIRFHPPDFIKQHHFPTPLLRPTVPPNSPENWRICGNTTNQPDDDIPTSLGERLAALSMARPGNEGVTTSEVKILKEETPKAPENPFYEIRPVPGKGYGCFAIKDIKRGTRILADDPLLEIPIAYYFESDIKKEFAKLSPAEQALYFTLHSAHGQDPNNWPKHIHDLVDAKDRCRIEEQHKARTGKEPSLISIFQTNCMEKDQGAAVFPHAARFNHSCNPNACFCWNPATKKETIHAIRDIKQDEQITLSYCDIAHDKVTRRWELKHYGFFCDCQACSGDDTDPQSFAGKSAARRYRLMELDNEFRTTRGQYIRFGASQPGFIEKLLEYAKLLLEEGDYTVRLANTYLDIALVCEEKGDLVMAKRSALKALRIKLETQGPDYPDIPQYIGVVQRIKQQIAEQEAEAGNNS